MNKGFKKQDGPFVRGLDAALVLILYESHINTHCSVKLGTKINRYKYICFSLGT